MPKRSRKVQKKRPVARDENQSAFDIIQQLIAQTEGTGGKDPLAVALGRRGGLKGGRARVDGMTKEELHKSAVKAARARWARKQKP
jgi:hypothetical protein